MNTAAIVPVNVTVPDVRTTDSMFRIAELAARSGLCSTRQPSDAYFVIAYGVELGIPPMTALRTIHVINNKPVCSGEAMLALIRRSGKVSMSISGDEKSATVTMKRKDSGDEYTAAWSMERANTAGVTRNATWQKFPSQMLKWRAISECAKFLCSDIIGGLYTVEEIAPETPMNADGEPLSIIVSNAPENAPVAPVASLSEPEIKPAKWWEQSDALEALKERCYKAGYIEHSGEKGIEEMHGLIFPKTWSDFDTRGEAAAAIRDAAEALKEEIAHKERETNVIGRPNPEPNFAPLAAPFASETKFTDDEIAEMERAAKELELA